MTSQILTVHRILEGVRTKNLLATILFVDFTKAVDSIYIGKIGENSTRLQPTKRNHHSYNDGL